MVTSIISIVISLLSLGLCVGILYRERKESKELDAMLDDLKSQSPEEYTVDSTIGDVVSYNKRDNTLVVKGNIKAEGYISAGNKEG